MKQQARPYAISCLDLDAESGTTRFAANESLFENTSDEVATIDTVRLGDADGFTLHRVRDPADDLRRGIFSRPVPPDVRRSDE